MNTVQVWNDDTKEYVEKFKGKDIKIPAGECIEMNIFEAAEFVGQYVEPIKDDAGRELNCKRLRRVALKDLEEVVEDKEPPKGYCILCNKDFGSAGLLAAHVKKLHAKYVASQAEGDVNDIKRTGNSGKTEI